MGHENIVISLTYFSSNTNEERPVIIAFLNSGDVVQTENICSQTENSVTEILPASASGMSHTVKRI